MSVQVAHVEEVGGTVGQVQLWQLLIRCRKGLVATALRPGRQRRLPEQSAVEGDDTSLLAALKRVGQFGQIPTQRVGLPKSGAGLVEEPSDRTEGVALSTAIHQKTVRRHVVRTELHVVVKPVALALGLPVEALVDTAHEPGVPEDSAHSEQPVARTEPESLRSLQRPVVPLE